MDPQSVVAGWKRRLCSLAKSPAYVFRDTSQKLIEQHRRGLTTFAGFSRQEVAEAEARLGLRFPTLFRTFLLEMAKHPGDLFCGSDLAGVTDFEDFRHDALELMAETDETLSLPEDAVVFLFHQGYTFVYLSADGATDGPPLQWIEGEEASREVAPTFEEMVDAELVQMEENNRKSRELGGYYLTLRPDGSATRTYPSVTSGERPLRRRWWKLGR